jgi:hypothetical protein
LAARRVPVLERRHVNIDPAAPRELGHPRVWLYAGDRAADRLELPGLDAGTAADIEHRSARTGGDDPIDKVVGIWRPGPVVTFGVGAE